MATLGTEGKAVRIGRGKAMEKRWENDGKVRVSAQSGNDPGILMGLQWTLDSGAYTR